MSCIRLNDNPLRVQSTTKDLRQLCNFLQRFRVEIKEPINRVVIDVCGTAVLRRLTFSQCLLHVSTKSDNGFSISVNSS